MKRILLLARRFKKVLRQGLQENSNVGQVRSSQSFNEELVVKLHKRELKFEELPPSLQTEEICLWAVRDWAANLQFVKNQTLDVCVAAIKTNPRAIRYVKNQTSDLCRLAVKLNWNSLEFVNNQTESIVKEAILCNYAALQYVKEQDVDICLFALEQDIKAMMYVRENLKKEVSTAYTMKYNRVIEYVKDEYVDTKNSGNKRLLCLEVTKDEESNI